MAERWSDQTPLECAGCYSIFGDDDVTVEIGGDDYCEHCAEKFLPDALDEIFGALEYILAGGPVKHLETVE